MTNAPPIFSVIVPTYNRANMVKRAIDSVLQQTFENFELIVIDDASSDDYSSISALTDKRIHYIRNPSNLGVSASRNVGLKLARGKYISLLDDDDEYTNCFLENTYTRLEKTSPEIGVSWCNQKFIYYNKNGNYHVTEKTFPSEYPDKEALFQDFPLIGTGYGITFKADCIKKVGFFNETLKVAEDTEFFIRCTINGFLPVTVPDTYIICHFHTSARLTHRYKEYMRTLPWMFKEYDDFFINYPAWKNTLIEHLKFYTKSHQLKKYPWLHITKENVIILLSAPFQLWHEHILTMPCQSVFARLVTFPRFLQKRYGLNKLWYLPFYLPFKIINTAKKRFEEE